MKSYDEMREMTDEEIIEYRDQQIESVIQKAKPKNVLKLRALHAEIKSLSRIKNPTVRAIQSNYMMIKSFIELNESLKAFK